MSGISSPWGMSPQDVAGMNNSLDFGKYHLTGELGLSSIPPTFDANGQFVSPLNVANKSYYTKFGKRSNKSNKALKKVNTDIGYLKRNLKKGK